MDGSRRLAAALLGTVGVGLAAAGPVMLLRGRGGRKEIRAELAAQKITFPDHGLPDELAAYAGRRVETGPDAHAYARFIQGNLAHTTGGRAYAEITAELHAAGGDDEKLLKLRQTAFTGQSLRASLMSAYQAWHLTTLVTGLGAALTGLGAALVATADALASSPSDRS
ncbi:hypothetical protein DZF91_06680 [Actinomadura logoneensis]|uniref:Aromatic ring-opening dioxygenase LigA n=1 Tax=Actinomadura logoneensis TaxID=2293572 RepID=A0A372JQU9_9ACTN|nr:hypothetical protein [Actinomadura logoneensis]RFU42412.1 hypothetical protein DZF91_06680 [Actinomadura logoneensis]